MVKEVFGKKIGMTQIFGQEGRLLPVTLVEVEPVYFLEKVSYPGKQMAKVGVFQVNENKISKVKKPQQGYFAKVKAPAFRMIKEVKIDGKSQDGGAQKGAEKKEDLAEEGKEKKDSFYFGINIFKEGEKITVRSKTKGKGFAGVIKRHNTHRQPSSHGSGMHRRVGSVGASATPSRIMKNKKMPGHLGSAYRTVKNLEILKIDTENKILFIKGSIPGSRKNILRITKQKISS